MFWIYLLTAIVVMIVAFNSILKDHVITYKRMPYSHETAGMAVFSFIMGIFWPIAIFAVPLILVYNYHRKKLWPLYI